MRVSLSWLQDLVQVNEAADQLGERLSMAGFEVEEIDDLSRLAQGVVVGHVLESEKHPNADKLSVCVVDIGAEETVQIVCGASNYPRIIDFARLRQIADKVGAYLMADIAHIAGLVVAGIHPNPFPHAHFVTTTTHKTLRGPRGGVVMCHEEFAQAIDKAVFPGIQG